MLRIVFRGERNSWLMFERKRDFMSEMRRSSFASHQARNRERRHRDWSRPIHGCEARRSRPDDPEAPEGCETTPDSGPEALPVNSAVACWANWLAIRPKSSPLKGIERWGIPLVIVTVAPSSDVSISNSVHQAFRA